MTAFHLEGSRRRGSRWLLLAAIGLVLAGCEESNDTGEFIPPPIEVRSSTPDALTQVGPNLETILITLTRPPAPGTLISRIYPEPLATSGFGPSNPESRRNWNWFDLELDEAAGAYHVMIDGDEMDRPYVLSFGVDDARNFSVGLGGFVRTPNFAVADPEPTVVFALFANTVFNPSEPVSWADAQGDVAGATSLFDDNINVDEPLPYRVSFLEEGRRYFVVAIQDTNGDLVYDPVTDWWAISRDGNGVFESFPARPFGGDKGEEEIAVDLFLRAPAGGEDEGDPDD